MKNVYVVMGVTVDKDGGVLTLIDGVFSTRKKAEKYADSLGVGDGVQALTNIHKRKIDAEGFDPSWAMYDHEHTGHIPGCKVCKARKAAYKKSLKSR